MVTDSVVTVCSVELGGVHSTGTSDTSCASERDVSLSSSKLARFLSMSRDSDSKATATYATQYNYLQACRILYIYTPTIFSETPSLQLTEGYTNTRPV